MIQTLNHPKLYFFNDGAVDATLGKMMGEEASSPPVRKEKVEKDGLLLPENS